jgi:hypothetical protein|tara:strand:- start:723 stop:1310 length:588 start_codon:yes stop_codon:yes gene_type:complete
MFDFSQYAEEIRNTTPALVDRAFLPEGTHIVKIEKSIPKVSQKTGNKLIILELSILASSDKSITPETPAKHFFSLSGVPEWKKAENLKYMKTLLLAVGGGRDASANLITTAYTDETSTILVGQIVKVIATTKVSQKGKEFVAYDFLKVDDRTREQMGKQKEEGKTDVNVAEGWAEAEGWGNTDVAETKTDDDIPF